MSSSQQDISALTTLLREGENLNDLLSLLNAIVKWQNSVHKTNLHLFTLKQLSFFYRKMDSKYHSFEIAKKSGGSRCINAPDKTLKAIQRCIACLLQGIYQAPVSVNGYVVGRSVVSNAKNHTNKNFVLNIDLQNFFPSVNFGRISAVLQLNPIVAKPRFAYLIAKFSCYKGVLPQGAPTSPVISNLICQRLDLRLTQLSKNQSITYTRYADDLTFSATKPFQNGFLNRLEEIIQEEGFILNPRKVRLLEKTMRQEVTGVTVNEKTNVPRTFIREIRAMLHNWSTMGYNEAQSKFLSSYKAPASSGEISQPQLRSVVGGKINYMKMVRGAEDPIYQGYKETYERLLKGEDILPTNMLPLQTVEHDPRQTVQVLRNFKVSNDSGFRELLHEADNRNFNFEANLDLVNKQLPSLSQKLPLRLYEKLVSFVKVYNNSGIAYFNKHSLLPLKGSKSVQSSSIVGLLARRKNKSQDSTIVVETQTEVIPPDEEVTIAAKNFRVQIRIGNDYFQDLVLVNSIKPIISKLNSTDGITVTYQPSEEEFGLNCEFFTDSWEVRKAIRSLIKDLAYNPFYSSNSKRKILIHSTVIKREITESFVFATVINIQLTDAVVKNENKALNHNRLIKTQQRLHMLADWSIIYQTSSYEQLEHFFLSSHGNKPHRQVLNGITHKLTFYHS